MVINGPAKSTAVWENACIDIRNRIFGRGAIIWVAALAFRRLHSAHSPSQARISWRPDMIQNLAEMLARVWFVPLL